MIAWDPEARVQDALTRADARPHRAEAENAALRSLVTQARELIPACSTPAGSLCTVCDWHKAAASVLADRPQDGGPVGGGMDS